MIVLDPFYYDLSPLRVNINLLVIGKIWLYHPLGARSFNIYIHLISIKILTDRQLPTLTPLLILPGVLNIIEGSALCNIIEMKPADLS